MQVLFVPSLNSSKLSSWKFKKWRSNKSAVEPKSWTQNSPMIITSVDTKLQNHLILFSQKGPFWRFGHVFFSFQFGLLDGVGASFLAAPLSKLEVLLATWSVAIQTYSKDSTNSARSRRRWPLGQVHPKRNADLPVTLRSKEMAQIGKAWNTHHLFLWVKKNHTASKKKWWMEAMGPDLGVLKPCWSGVGQGPRLRIFSHIICRYGDSTGYFSNSKPWPQPRGWGFHPGQRVKCPNA